MKKKVKHPDGFKEYQDAAGEWRWQLWHKGRIIAASGEGYKRIAKCRAAMHSVSVFAPVAPTVRMSIDDVINES